MNWSYADTAEQVVTRVLEDGSRESCLVGVIGDWIGAGNRPAPYSPSSPELIAANIAAVQVELDGQAQAKGYDNIVSACSYAAGAQDSPFAAEGKAFLAWRSAAWAHAHSILAEVEAGSRPMPTPEESVAMMPPLVLPS